MAKKAKYSHAQYKYLVVIEWSPEDQIYVAKVPELLGCSTHGKTIQGAAKHVADAIATWIDGAKEAEIDIPEPIASRKFSGRFVTRIDPELHRQLVIQAKQKGKPLNSIVTEVLKESLT